MTFTHQRRDIDCRSAVSRRLLQTSTHGKVFVNGCKVVLAVPLRNDTKQLDMIQDLIVESEVIAWDDVDASIFLNLPVFKSQSLSLSQQIIL